MTSKYAHVYLIQQRDRGHLVKKQYVRLVDVIPALQKVSVIPVSDLVSKKERFSESGRSTDKMEPVLNVPSRPASGGAGPPQSA